MTVWRSIGRIALVSFSLALAGYLVWAAQRGATTTPVARPDPGAVPAVQAPTPIASDAVALPATDPAFFGTSKSLAPDAIQAPPATGTGDPAFLYSSKSLGWAPLATPPPSVFPPLAVREFQAPAEPAPVFLPSSKSRAPAGPRPELPKETAPPKAEAPGGKP